MRRHPSSLILFVLLAAPVCGCASDHDHVGDRVERSIVVMADLQIGEAAAQETAAENPSSTNLPQLAQTVADIAALPRAPDHTFVLGDLVMAEAPDQGQVMRTQLDAWIEAFRGFPGNAETHLVPLPGNHEMNQYDTAVGDQAPSPYSYAEWSEWTAENGLFPFAANGPRPEGENPDALVLDESRYTFSFDWGPVHVVNINTETLTTVVNPATGLPYQGWIPIHWITAELERAQANPAVESILVLGHRPIEAPAFLDPSYSNTILNIDGHTFADQLAALLESTPKVRAYLCSHVHMIQVGKLASAPRVWQIISGNAGAELESPWTPDGGPYFGFAELDLHRSGRMTLVSYGREVPPAPQAFYEGTPVAPAPATVRDTIDLD